MVEISNARYEELIRVEATFNNLKRIAKTVPSYKWDEALKALIMEESEVKTDAE